MNEVFKDLDGEKQQKILNAAYKEFAEQGYAKASTNRIVKDAGISKGLLFYYFNSKRELYGDLIEIGMKTVEELYLEDMKLSGDYFERFYQASLVKLRVYRDNPHVLNFLARILFEPAETLTEPTSKHLDQLRLRTLSQFSADTDPSLAPFRTDIPREDVLKIVRWIMEGYENELIHTIDVNNLSHIDIELALAKYRAFLESLKKLFYIQNYQTTEGTPCYGNA